MKDVELDDLHLVQDRLDVVGLLNAVDGGLPMHGDAIPHVIDWNGRLFVEDGHHRVVAAEVARRLGVGPGTIAARVHRC